MLRPSAGRMSVYYTDSEGVAGSGKMLVPISQSKWCHAGT